ncbi:MAG TPA: ABC transporter ATP-binding protein [Myxococcota bacterium]|nr:ABC transporter ATP-binding protein [Myxococcota bacterium]HRY97313.1 ABC transporter ATP-binding protein [Myxococcota bacterium]HSA23609.1 ABC transporter ATP-binding protein [Myxococcota bacterium]
MSTTDDAVLALSGVSRAFGAVLANDRVDLRVTRGHVHALVGENGAGKSTLMRVAYGELRADGGEIRLKGELIPRERHSPREAIRRGVGMVHQHFMLVPTLSVVENVVLGREPLRRGLLDLAGPAGALRELSRRFGLEVEPRARVEELSVGERQRVEILRVLWQGCDVLILDEPTAVLAPAEVRRLFGVLADMAASGLAVVLITHKLDEVCALAERVTVMRQGRVVDELDGRVVSAATIARAMVGREVLLRVERGPRGAPPGAATLLRVDGLRVTRGEGTDAVSDLSLVVKAGEIVGLAGVEGNGQRELVEALVGLRPQAAGSISLAGRELSRLGVGERLAAGLGHVPEDRLARGLVLDFSLEENLALGRQGEFCGWFGLDRRRLRVEAIRLLAEGDVRPAEPLACARALSGGNQQKVVMARELSRPAARVLLCAQPTRGVDIGAIEHIHRGILAARGRGVGVLLASADLPELLALSDRVLVMFKGRVAGQLAGAELDAPGAAERLGELMTGAGGAT